MMPINIDVKKYLHSKTYQYNSFEIIPDDSLRNYKIKMPKNPDYKTPREEHFSSLEEKEEYWIAYINYDDLLRLFYKNHLKLNRKLREYIDYKYETFLNIEVHLGFISFQEPDSVTVFFHQSKFKKDDLELFNEIVEENLIRESDKSKYFGLSLSANKINQLHKEVNRKPFRRLTKENVLFYLDDLGIHGINCEDIEMVENLPFYGLARVKLSNEIYNYFVKDNQRIKGKFDILSNKDNTKYIDITKVDQDFE